MGQLVRKGPAFRLPVATTVAPPRVSPRARAVPAVPAAAVAPVALGGRIPSLDGLRALSILLVIVSHARTTTGVPLEVRRWVSAVPGNGALGVSIFFVLSGFLITHLLVRGQETTAGNRSIDLKGFYLRRFCRIVPAFYALLLVLAIGQHWRWISVPKADLFAAALFVTNYAPLHTPEWIGHAWSLCVEEQFYLIWPVLLAILARWGRPAQRRAAVVLILLIPAVRIASWVLLPHDHLLVRRMPVLTHARLDTLMFGCLAALLYPSARFQGVLRRVFDSRLQYGAFAFLFLVSPYLTTWIGERYLVLGGYSLEGVCIALLLLWAVRHPLGRAGRLLNSWPVVHIGLISYSLYLWQQLFLLERNHTWTGVFPLNILLAFAAAEASYWLIERPVLRVRDRLTGRRRYQTPVALPAGGETLLPLR
jgi:peptidoglycan/LPS O-acetylase OafA/YrhL